MRAIQKFSKEYLDECKKLTPLQIVCFIEDFRKIHGSPSQRKSKLISLKVAEDLLQTFRTRCELEGLSYQTQIKNLMLLWLKAG